MIHRRIARCAAACGWFAVLAGCSVLFGWTTNIVWLKSVIPGFIAMNPLTALCFCLAGGALLLLNESPPRNTRRRLGLAFGVLVATVGAIRVADYVFQFEFDIDRLLFAASLDDNRIAPNTAICLILCGLSLATLDIVTRRGFWPAQVPALAVATVSLVSLVGYAYGAELLYRIESYIPMALHTAFVLHLLSLGILLSRAERGIVAIVLHDGLGGSMARRLLPAVVGIPCVLGWLRVLGQHLRLYDTEFGAALMVAATVILLLVVICWIAALLNRVDSERQQTMEKLRQSDQSLRQLNDGLEQRIRDRTSELAATNADLLQKNRENEMFVYSVSHDLRSPLVNLQGFSKELTTVSHSLRDLIASQQLPVDVHKRSLCLIDEDMQQSIRFIQSAVSRLSGIIDALLRLSRAGRVEYQPRAVDVEALVTRILEAMSGTIYDRGASIEIGDLPTVWGDPTAIEQVFANLINNAINYLDPNRPGCIEIGSQPASANTSDDRRWCTIFVKDNGLGIPQAYHDKVFQALKRLHPNVAKGEGIGLAIVRRIVERHGGTIRFESTNGLGTTFFVDLPCAEQASPPANRLQRRIENDARSIGNLVG